MPPEPGRGSADAPVHGPLLPRLARAILAERLEVSGPPPAAELEAEAGPGATAFLDAPAACFVTLTREGKLRGCIGSIEAWRPLREDLAGNAVAAALRDPRFPPLTAADLPAVRIEVSILSPPEPLDAASEAEAAAALRPGVDGVVLRAGSRRGTFLPQVWEQLPDPGTFLAHLRLKAGLHSDRWDDDIRLETYTVSAWHEEEA